MGRTTKKEDKDRINHTATANGEESKERKDAQGCGSFTRIFALSRFLNKSFSRTVASKIKEYRLKDKSLADKLVVLREYFISHHMIVCAGEYFTSYDRLRWRIKCSCQPHKMRQDKVYTKPAIEEEQRREGILSSCEQVTTGGNSFAMSGTGVCFDWTRTGSCSYGSKCKFAHPPKSGTSGSRGVGITSGRGGGNKNAAGQKGYSAGGSTGSGSNGVCYEWQRTGKCSRGNNCKFQHGTTGSGRGGGGGGAIGGNGGKGICFEWQRTGNCSRGNNCRFQHVRSGGQGAASGSHREKIKSTTGDLSRFITHLSVLPRHKLGDELLRSASLWRRCWRSHDSLDRKLYGNMIEVLAKIPGSSSVDPPDIQEMQGVVKKFLENEANASIADDKVLTCVKTVKDAVTRGLDFEWMCAQDSVRQGLSAIIILAEGRLRKQQREHRDVASSLIEILGDIEKPWRISVRENAQSEDEDGGTQENCIVTYRDWQAPKMDWICNPDFFSPSRCPKMTGQNGLYESPEDYMNCVLRLWIAMTFSEGHAALAPHCRSRGQSMACGNALWPVSDSSQNGVSGLRCRTRECKHPVEFCCRIKNHDSLCGKCAAKSVQEHMGGPGQKASTHVYDCKVKFVDSDGVAFFTDFESRNPPQAQIHWRTTKRLSPPNLVGVVSLKSKGNTLEMTDLIKWGEIVYHGYSRDEEKRRQNKQLAVNFSTISTDFEPEYFEEGSYVAVIDCMTFVPEWIPVLKALQSQSQARLPFDNGRYLNLMKNSPVDDQNSVLDTLSPDEVSSGDILNLIDDMVEMSALEPIKEVRRDKQLKSELVSKLGHLVTATTLDKMQLVSFIDSLRNPVHLTQGPPGTGKSYLGVVLVRALIIVRDLWMKKSSSVGLRPILVLSYKNHAIDEFLVDLVKTETSILSSNKMIRIGGQCQDSRLIRYSERSAYDNYSEVTAAKTQIDNLNLLRESIEATMFGKMSSFMAFFQQIFHESDPQVRKKSATDATNIVMECIVKRHLLLLLDKEGKDDSSTKSPSGITADLDFLKLSDSGNKPSRQVSKMVNNSDGSRLITALLNEVAHYGQEHWGDVLMRWLSGLHPLPPCEFKTSPSEICGKLSLSTDCRLCHIHRCSFSGVDEGQCKFPCKSKSSHFCVGHGCSASNCPKNRIPIKGQQFCREHSCRRCLELNTVSELASDPPPYNVCDKHPFCMFPTCMLYPSSSEERYCKEHSVVRCQGLTRKGKPCKGKARSRMMPFCSDHSHLAGNMFREIKPTVEENSAVSDIALPKRCQFTKKKGGQCKAYCMPGEQYCSDHREIIRQKDPQGQAMTAIRSPSSQDAVGTGNDKKELLTSENASVDKGLEQDDDASSTSSSASENNESCTKGFVDGDEMEVEEEEEGENLKHLRDVFEVDDDDVNLTYIESDEANDELDLHEQLPKSCQEPEDWTWDLSLESRWEACQALMSHLHHLLLEKSLPSVKAAIQVARKDLQIAKVRAKAKAYENKSIIGGTMVGCITRLESIRKTRPFAVIVEEASEVLEPLLFSCLSDSTMKLEMIGDHRQLQPSLMSRYDFEIFNKVNISMFQRLIEAPEGHEVPSTVLSVQRRMRKNICDLTRNFYSDIIEIEDHSTCSTQTIGDRLSSSGNQLVRSAATQGREIPGVMPHIFLWTHNGTQQRSRVGISRINPDEAKMASSLAAYLVDCGVPRTSIAILTPYKGQLLEIRGHLQSGPRRLLSRDPDDKDVCRLSTIDRFQGDEEDVIIISLVVDENSKTEFVRKVNRLVVLLSRARLGLYILGNTGYFECNKGLPRHWANTFDLLQNPASNDSGGNEYFFFEGEQVGTELPLCCPLHRNVVFNAKSHTDLKLGYCKELCQDKLNCGHECSLPCHWPRKNHRQHCSIEMDSPCAIHPRKVVCHSAFLHSRGAPQSTKFTEIMKYYQCPIVCSITLPCCHTIDKPCHEERMILNGKQPMPPCNKRSPFPYTFPSCGHSKSVTCAELVLYNADPARVRCEEDDLYTPPCGHDKAMKCWMKTRVEANEESFACKQARLVQLPRCGHEAKIPCSTADLVEKWSGVSCEEVGVIDEGVAYGIQDYPCKAKATLRRKCGHTLTLPCGEAFAKSTSLDSCRKTIKIVNPGCGHSCQVACHLAKQLENQHMPAPPKISDQIQEGDIPTRAIVNGLPKCNELVSFKRKCGHVEQLPCSQISKPKIGCKVESTVKSPLCGHQIKTPCFLVNELEKARRASPANQSGLISSVFSAIDRLVSFDKLKTYNDFSTLSNDARKVLLTCGLESKVTLSCGHDSKMKCSKLLRHLEKGDNETDNGCNERVDVCLPCGHHIDMTCKDLLRHKQGLYVPKCCGTKTIKCWNYDRCSSTVEVECGFNGIAACKETSTWVCPTKEHEYQLNICAKGDPHECPGCSLNKLSSLISSPEEFTGEKELKSWINESAPQHKIEWISQGKLQFIENEAELLRYYRSSYEKEDPWTRPLFKCYRTPCFRVLTKENRKLNAFDPAKLVKKHRSIFGIVMTILSKENLTKACESMNAVTLLVGFTASVKVKQLSYNPIKSEMKEKVKLYESASSEGYDTLYFRDDKNVEKMIVWEPFACVALARLTLNKSQLASFAERMGNVPSHDFQPAVIKFHSPPDDIKIAPRTAAQSALEDADDDSSAEGDEHEVTQRFNGTILENLTLDCSWTGGINSKGILPSSTEKNLIEKMQFVNADASPFAAIEMIRNLLKQKDFAILHLLMAAEMTQHSHDDATASFRRYLELLSSSKPSAMLHPWAIVVASRLSNPPVSTSLIATFAEYFPSQCHILTSTEMDAYESDEDSDDGVGIHDLLRRDWTEFKAKNIVTSDATDSLMDMIGLQKVKEEVLSLWKSAMLLKKMEPETRKENRFVANYVFLGNPGVGKTTVARHFARILVDSGIRVSTKIVETTAQKLKDDGSDKFRSNAESAMGGVLFIDEAYDLDPVGDLKGKPIVNELLTLCEDKRDNISVILAGYEDDFQKKFFSYNPGLKSRFKEVIFEDFDEKELSTIWTASRIKKKWEEENGVCDVAVRKLMKKSGRKGFGNAREVRRLLESATQKALARQDESFSPDDMVIEIRDIIGDDPRLKNEKLQRILVEIDEKIGWDRVKERVHELIDLCGRNYQLELLGKPPFQIFLNRMFLGNPGTGKTTAAKIYGRLLKELGFLSSGEVVSKSASDFIGQYIGQSQTKTIEIIEGASGKVLLIDEAYALDDSWYGKQVLDTLVEKVQGTPSDDIAVILIGYEEPMAKMLREQNPGLARRFPKEHAFYFDDYTDSQLLAILELNIKRQQIKCSFDFKEKALKILKAQKRQANFGNAGAVESLIKGAMQKASKRTTDENISLQDIDIEDSGAARAHKIDDPLSMLDSLYRMEKIKNKLSQMQKLWSVERSEGGDNLELGHFVFLGSPGTGKTTVGRVIADVLYSLDLIPSNKFVETSALKLTGEYVGQTKVKVEKTLKEALGGVMFIDEAYNLGQGIYGQEAVDTLVEAMTSETYKDLIIIIAGYPSEINEMLNSNAGLKSRFTHFFQFPDWNPEDCESFFASIASKEGFETDPHVNEVLKEGCSRLIQLKGWANGRDVKKIWSESKSLRAERVYNQPEVVKRITASDISTAVNSILQSRIGKLSDFDPNTDPLAVLDGLFRMDTIKAKLQVLQRNLAVAKREGSDTPDLGHFVFTGSPGTGKTTVARAIANILFRLQLKSSDKVIEKAALDLVADYVGQTKTIVHKILDDAKGGCLFVDEAYNLGVGQFGKEACDTIVAAMTSEEYQNVTIIFAGYAREIDDMFRSNSGLKSRFTHFFEFPDWTADDCVNFFGKCASNECFLPLCNESIEALRDGFGTLVGLEGWGNGRDVKRVWDETKSQRANRVYAKPDPQKALIVSDVQKALSSIIKSRVAKSRKPNTLTRQPDQLPTALPPTYPLDIHPNVETLANEEKPNESVEMNAVEEVLEANEEHAIEDEGGKSEKSESSDDESSRESDEDEDDSELRDDGVPDEVWDELEDSKKREREEAERLILIQEELMELQKQEHARNEQIQRLQDEMKRQLEELGRLAAVEEERKKEEEEARRIAEEARRAEELARLRAEAEERKRREDEARRIAMELKRKEDLERKRKQAEEKRRQLLEEEKRSIKKQEEIKRRLRQISPCPAGFSWHQVGGGWRCGGGSHFVSNEKLQRDFGYDI